LSDISIHFTWWELLLYSPVWGWPGLLVGGLAGAIFARKRRVLGAIVLAVAGNFLWFAAVLFSR
jgi:hypothetical protein